MSFKAMRRQYLVFAAKAAFSRVLRETAMEVSSISARLRYLGGVVGKEGDVAKKRAFAALCAVVAVKGGSRWKRSGSALPHF